MNVVFMGTPSFALSSMKALIDHPHVQLSLVVSQPDRPKGRGKKITHPEVIELAKEKAIPYIQPEKIKDPDVYERLSIIKPDLIVVTAYGQLLPKRILDLPVYGCVNVHASLLPKLRGAAPIQFAIWRGDKEGGVTMMQMNERLDEGDILLQKKISITEDMNIEDYQQKLEKISYDIVMETIDQLRSGNLNCVGQDHSKASYSKILSKKDGNILWNNSARSIYNQIKALNPWPGTYTFLGEDRWKIKKASVLDQISDQKPGTILSFDKKGIKVSTGDGVLLVERIQLPRKKEMAVADYLNGNQPPRLTVFKNG